MAPTIPGTRLVVFFSPVFVWISVVAEASL
jgi:hypothetical protein